MSPCQAPSQGLSPFERKKKVSIPLPPGCTEVVMIMGTSWQYRQRNDNLAAITRTTIEQEMQKRLYKKVPSPSLPTIGN